MQGVHQRFHFLAKTVPDYGDHWQIHPQTSYNHSQKFQVVGVGATFLASLYEQMFAGEVGGFLYILIKVKRKIHTNEKGRSANTDL